MMNKFPRFGNRACQSTRLTMHKPNLTLISINSNQQPRNKQEHNWQSDLRSTFLTQYLAIFLDLKLSTLTVKRSTRCTTWFHQRLSSNFTWSWRAVVIWWFSGRDWLKQMHMKVPDDEWRMNFSSTIFETAPNKICHGWSSIKQSTRTALQLYVVACKGLKNDGGWWNN
jgi:hypothetical protein